MTRSRFAKCEDGQWRWFTLEKPPASEQLAPFVHQDSFKPGMRLRHPVTGEVVDNHTRWNEINRSQGLSCVGNDLLSKRPGRGPERITEEVILDRIQKAEAICSDPARKREYDNMNMQLNERNRRLLDGIG